MAKHKFHLVDVFTDQAFGGNQLAVFPNGAEVPSELMQKIARELNFSETTFVFPPKNKKNNAWVRIFTPARELKTGRPSHNWLSVCAGTRRSRYRIWKSLGDHF